VGEHSRSKSSKTMFINPTTYLEVGDLEQGRRENLFVLYLNTRYYQTKSEAILNILKRTTRVLEALKLETPRTTMEHFFLVEACL
jgi:hypothetical protein